MKIIPFVTLYPKTPIPAGFYEAVAKTVNYTMTLDIETFNAMLYYENTHTGRRGQSFDTLFDALLENTEALDVAYSLSPIQPDEDYPEISFTVPIGITPEDLSAVMVEIGNFLEKVKAPKAGAL